MNLTNKNVVLIANDVALGRLLAKTLLGTGYTVTHFDSVESYMEKGFEIEYALYLVDVKLPGLSGIDFVKAKRRACKLMPIYILSDDETCESIIEGLRSGADDYITKPLHLPELQIRIDVGWKKLLHFIEKGYIRSFRGSNNEGACRR